MLRCITTSRSSHGCIVAVSRSVGMDPCVVVVSNADGRKYKMMMKGDLSLVTIGKIKRYLASATGILPSEQRLSFNHAVADDDSNGHELGLYDGAVLFLDRVAAPHRLSPSGVADITVDSLLRRREDEAAALRQRVREAREREWAASSQHERSINAFGNVLREQQTQIDELRRSVPRPQSPQRPQLVAERLDCNLDNLSARLRLTGRVALDRNNTAVLPIVSPNGTEVSLLLTFDAQSSRLYLYSTLLSQLPDDAARKMELYELLLEGALLGREMAGGGVGISVKSQLVLLSTSLDIKNAGDLALSDLVPQFLEAVHKWTEAVRRFC
jgi:hypothetical protein